MVVAHNIQAANAQRQYKLNTSSRAKNTEKLSSGYKINRAADDAAGLTISEKMRSQIRGLTQASTNCQDGVSFVQIADGALAEVHDMLDRMVELTVQASNGTNTDADREAIQSEIAQLKSEIDRVHQSTEFNTIPIFPDGGHSPEENFNIAEGNSIFTITNGDRSITFEFVANGNNSAVNSSTTGGTNNLPVNYTNFVKKAVQDAVYELSNKFPKLFNGVSDGIQIGLNAETTDGAGGVLASAVLSFISNGETTGMTYTLNIDKTDYDPNTFDPLDSAQAAKAADLAATIAHEMTHFVMYDALTPKMMGSNSFPDWIIEGVAQTASGDNGWVSNHINSSSSDDDIKNYMSQIGSKPYGAGYMAVMTLGLEVAKAKNTSTTATSAEIATGLDEFLGEMVSQFRAGNPIDIDLAIANVTTPSGGTPKYTNLKSFYNAFKSGNADLLADMKSILTARDSGAGSLLGNLDQSESDLFATTNLTGSYTSFTVDSAHKTVQNIFGGGIIPPAPDSLGGIGGGNGGGGDDIIIQCGAAMGHEIPIMRFKMTSDAIFDSGTVDASTAESAKDSIQVVNDAISRVSKVRSYYGAIQNRLEHTIKNLDNVVENTQAAESKIRDTDMASEMVQLTKNNILIQAGEAMMAQANQSTQGVLSLLQ